MRTTSPHRREREFGLLVGGVLCLLGSWWLYRGRAGAFAGVLLAAGALLVLLGALLPAVLGIPYRGWMKLAEALSVVMTNLILAIVYYGIVTPLGLLRKALGGDPLRRRSRPAESYWCPYSDRQRDPRHYEKMY
jgi:hypothetical protein